MRSLLVVEAVGEVISWHRRGLLRCASALTPDPRTPFAEADFFALAASAEGFGGGPVDAILLDVYHSPRHVLAPANAALYIADGLRRLAAHLRDGGVFALWSDDPPDAEFEAALSAAFDRCASHVVPFANPITGGTSANTVYVATTASGAAASPG